MRRTLTIVVIAILAVSGCSSSSGGARASDGSRQLARARALAAEGEAGALVFIRVVHRPSNGCPRPSYYATVGKDVTGRRLAADELAFFAQREKLDQGRCAAFLYVYFSGQTTEGTGGYTAGAVIDQSRLLEVHAGNADRATFASFDYS